MTDALEGAGLSVAQMSLSVAQMSMVTGVSAHTLRYYERVGLIRPVARNSGNQRCYHATDVEWVKFLLRLRETGMPIAQMRVYAQLRSRGDVTIAPRLRLLEEHQRQLREQIARLRDHETALAAKIATYRQDLDAHHVGTNHPSTRADQGEIHE